MTIPDYELNTIIVGHDFSEQSRQAFRAAAALADQHDASLEVAAVISGRVKEHLTGVVSLGARKIERVEQDTAVQETIEDLMRRELKAPKGVALSFSVNVGKASEALMARADATEADLIVVGATGLGRIKKFVFGSTAERLVRSSERPVLVARDGRPMSRIICATNFSPASRRAAAVAVTIARAAHAPLEVVHVVDVPARLTTQKFGAVHLTEAEKARVRQAREDFDAFLQDYDLEDLDWSRHEPHGALDPVIVDMAEEIRADLIVIGNVGRQRLEKLIVGNSAERLLPEAPCSMLVVKSG